MTLQKDDPLINSTTGSGQFTNDLNLIQRGSEITWGILMRVMTWTDSVIDYKGGDNVGRDDKENDCSSDSWVMMTVILRYLWWKGYWCIWNMKWNNVNGSVSINDNSLLAECD